MNLRQPVKVEIKSIKFPFVITGYQKSNTAGNGTMLSSKDVIEIEKNINKLFKKFNIKCNTKFHVPKTSLYIRYSVSRNFSHGSKQETMNKYINNHNIYNYNDLLKLL